MDPQYGAEYASLYNHHWWWRTREKIVVDTIRKYTSKLGNKSKYGYWMSGAVTG